MYAWQPRWQFLDEIDLIYFFCELDIAVHCTKFDDRMFPARLKRHFKRRGVTYRWQPVLSELDAMDLPFLSQFVRFSLTEAQYRDPQLSDKMRVHFAENDDGVYQWAPDVTWLGTDELPYVIKHFPCEVSEERFREGSFPDRLRGHFRPKEAQSGQEAA